MKTYLTALLITSSLLLGCSDDSKTAEKQTEGKQPAPIVERSVNTPKEATLAEKSQQMWEQTKKHAGDAMDKGKEVGSSVVQKSQSLYDQGKQQGNKLVYQSKEAWDKTKKYTAEKIDQGKTLGEDALEKAGEVGEELKEKSKQLYDDATTKQSDSGAAPVREL